MKRRLFLLIQFFLYIAIFVNSAKGQISEDINQYIPKMATPNASMFQKFIDIPVNKYTGVTNNIVFYQSYSKFRLKREPPQVFPNLISCT